MTDDPARHQLPDAENARIFEEDIKPRIFSRVVAQERPVAIIFGGQPGSGKSAAVDKAVGELAPRGGCIEIIGDDLRPHHPAYADLMARDDRSAAFFTDRDSARWVERALVHAREVKVNVVVEGTFRNPEVVTGTMRAFRQAGFQIEARVLAVNRNFSLQGILQRYEVQKFDRGAGRMTSDAAHEAAYAGLPQSLALVEEHRLADRLTVYRRGAQRLYTNHLQHGEWKEPSRALEVLTAERERPLSLSESRELLDGYRELETTMGQVERGASPEEVRRLHELKRSAVALHQAAAFRELPREDACRLYPGLAATYVVAAGIEREVVKQDPGIRPALRVAVLERIARAIEEGQDFERMKLRSPHAEACGPDRER